AIAAFAEILPLTPGDRSVREAYVDLLVQLKELTQASEQLELLIEQHPDDPELLVKLAGLHFDAKNPKATQEALAKYLEKSEPSEYAYLRAARLLERYQLPEAAEETYRKLREA